MGHNERQVVGVIYRHPNADIFQFQENLKNLLRELNNKKLNYILIYCKSTRKVQLKAIRICYIAWVVYL